MKKIITTLFLFATLTVQAQKSEGLKFITLNGIESKVAFLASDLIEGREAGEKGNFIAAEYIAARFNELGLTPYNVNDKGILTKYMQPFKAIKVKPKGAQVVITNGTTQSTYNDGVDFDYNYSSQSFKINSTVIIYDGTQDCSEKVIVVSDKELIEKAKKADAAAILIYNETENNKSISENAFTYHYNEAMYEGEKPRKVFKDTKLVLEGAKSATPTLNISKPVFEALKNGSKINIKIDVATEAKYLRNVIGCIEGEIKDEYVVIGTHFDHYGNQNGYIYNGADDNASGTAAVMQIAEAFIKNGEKPKRTIIFALWDGEERGLLGSKYYTSQIDYLGKIKGYINFDMIGRDSDPKSTQSVAYMYTEAFPQFEKWLKSNIKEYNLSLKPNYAPWDNPIGGSDNASFALHGIPIAWYHTGGHPDYHQPSDHTEKINWDKMLNITRSAYLVLYDLSNQ